MNISIRSAHIICLCGMLFFSVIVNAADLNSTTPPIANNQLSLDDQKTYDEALNLINQFSGKGNQYETAYKMLADLSSRNPKSGYPYAALADLKYRLAGMGDGTYADAYTLAQRALKLDPNIADAYVVVAKVMIEQKNMNAAREAANKAIALSPDKPEAMFAMARVAEVTLQYDESEHWYRKAIDAYKDNILKSNIYYWLGGMLSNKTPADINGAIEAYTKAAELNSETGPWMLNNIGWFLIDNTDRYDQAIDYLERALKIMDFGTARRNLALAEYFKWGDSLQNPQKYKNATRKPLSPEIIAATTGVTPEYAFVMNAAVKNVPSSTSFALLNIGLINNVDVIPSGTVNTALSSAAYYKHWDLVKALVAKGANVNAGNNTAIFYAVSQGNIEMVKFLFEKGARINLVDSSGYPVVSYALNQKVGKPASVLDYLMEHGADPTLPDKNGSTLIVLAVLGNDVDGVSLLVNKYHADANAKYFKIQILEIAAEGSVPLEYASVTKSKAIVEILLKAGANPWIKNSHGDDLMSTLMGTWSEKIKLYPSYKVTAPLIMEARKSTPKPPDFGPEYQGK